ncbi:MAG: hypothetical protein ACREUT_20295 [Steroidobacteraceae bacterium]
MPSMVWRMRERLAERSRRFQFPPQRIEPPALRERPLKVPLPVALQLLGFGILAVLLGGGVLLGLGLILWVIL